jgi:hypothetical protein
MLRAPDVAMVVDAVLLPHIRSALPPLPAASGAAFPAETGSDIVSASKPDALAETPPTNPSAASTPTVTGRSILQRLPTGLHLVRT